MDEINGLTRENGSSDILALTHEITYRRYLMNKGKIKELFEKLSIPEYIALYNIDMERELSSIYGEKTYLKDLSEKMELSMRKTSRMIGNLRDRGLLLWSHDGNGSEGTYVIITDSGKKLLKEQEEVLRKFYGNVIDKFGKEKLIQLLQLMKELDTIMCSEFEDMEEEDGEEII